MRASLRTICLAVFTLSAMRLGRAQDLLKRLELEAPIRPPLTPHSVEDALEAHVQVVAARLSHLSSKQSIDASRTMLRNRLTESLGHQQLPWPPDLRATTLGTINGRGYHVEKLGYQTLQNVLATALIYVPDDLNGLAPTVLLVAGQAWPEGKAQPDAQLFGINMARLGFVVMIADSIGVGERRPPENRRVFAEALLVGVSQPGIVEYETQCALQYLRTRKDVDAKRIGLIGVAGRGLGAWITMALDDRIAAAVIVDGTFDFVEELHRMRSANGTQVTDQSGQIPGVLQYANIQELIGLAAPRPILVSSPPSIRPLFEFARVVYGNFEKAAQMHLFESQGLGLDAPRREAVYGFFSSVLLNRGDGTAIYEHFPEEHLRDGTEVACLPGGQLAPAGIGIFETVQKLLTADTDALPKFAPEILAGLEPEWGNATLGINAFAIHRRNLASERGIQIPVTILRPPLGETPQDYPKASGGGAGTLLVLDENDKEALTHDPIVEEALRRDYMVVEMDPRGFGEIPIQNSAWVSAASLLLGENFVWRQAWDIYHRLDGFPFIRSNSKIRAVYARGPNASLAATYALWLMRSQQIDWAVLRGGFTTIRQLSDNPSAKDLAFSFGGAKSLDISELLLATKTKTFMVEPIDPAFTPKTPNLRVVTAHQFVGGVW